MRASWIWDWKAAKRIGDGLGLVSGTASRLIEPFLQAEVAQIVGTDVLRENFPVSAEQAATRQTVYTVIDQIEHGLRATGKPTSRPRVLHQVNGRSARTSHTAAIATIAPCGSSPLVLKL